MTDGLKVNREVANDLPRGRPTSTGTCCTTRLLADRRVEHIDLSDAYAWLNTYDG